MLKYATYLLLLLLASQAEIGLYAQTLPDKPEITHINVSDNQEMLTIYWTASETPDIDNYELYTIDDPFSSNPTGTKLLATVDGCSLQCSIPMSLEFPETYTVIAIKGDKHSLLSGNYHRPVKLELDYDSCAAEMTLRWTEHLGWEEYFSGYRIFQVNMDGSKDELLIANSSVLSYTHQMIEENASYKYQVEAFDARGYKSVSNRDTFFTYMPPPPEYTYLDYVSVRDENTIEISFTTELTGEINDFMILKSSSSNGVYQAWMTLEDIIDEHIVVHDYSPSQTDIRYYRVDALNNCGRQISSSNIGSNILLRGQSEGHNVHLRWNEYNSFANGLEEYVIYRQNPYNELETVTTVAPGTTSYIDPVEQSANHLFSGEFSYLIEAFEKGTNPLENIGVSRSNMVRISIESSLIVPNAFSPNADLQNDVFLPVYNFRPKEYRMLIYDRSGKMIFSSTSPEIGWNGSISNSRMASEGSYVYHIDYLSHTGRRQVLTGNVTLIY